MIKTTLKVLALFALAFVLGYVTPSAKADGSDPMPICRQHIKACLPLTASVVRDGGPLPLCPPWKKCCSLKGPTCNKPNEQ